MNTISGHHIADIVAGLDHAKFELKCHYSAAHTSSLLGALPYMRGKSSALKLSHYLAVRTLYLRQVSAHRAGSATLHLQGL